MSGTSQFDAGLDRRQCEVLSAALGLYFADGVPVSSKALAEAREDGLSPATLRNVLADLEAAGFMRQPHTSAGRVPTPKAIRWWLQHLGAEIGSDSRAAGFERTLLDAHDEASIWREASHFLSAATHHVGLAAIQPRADIRLKSIRLMRLTERRVVAILIAADGEARERICRVPETWTQVELDQAARYINQNFTGWTLPRIRRELHQRLAEERLAYDAMLTRLAVLAHCGALALDDAGEVFIEGASQLAGLLDASQLAPLLASLETRERWLRLLHQVDEAADAIAIEAPAAEVGRRRALRVQVDLAHEQLPGFSLVSTQCGAGAVAILGPLRMEYAGALRAVALVGEVVDRLLGDN